LFQIGGILLKNLYEIGGINGAVVFKNGGMKNLSYTRVAELYELSLIFSYHFRIFTAHIVSFL